jgi:prepilin-type N-terminal cleavage/methylation domain-containing protein
MKRAKGFSFIELMTSIAILSVVMGSVVGALVQAQKATNAVALMANTQENLRAGMHFMVRDLTQAGEGVPPQGVFIPLNTAGLSNLNRPGTTPATTFPTSYTVLPVITPGSAIGQDAKTLSPSGLVLDGSLKTDIINVLYADNSLVDSSGVANPPALNAYTVTSAAAPVCAGAIAANGSSVRMDPACFTMPGTPTPISAGNLILFTNGNGTALEYVTSVSGQTINFAAGDPAGLNGLSAATYPNGTVQAISASTTATTVTRVWLVSYYIDSTTNPSKPQLVRQVNYPGYPAGAPANPAQPVADSIENLTFSYDVTNSTDPAGTYANGPGDAPQPVAPDTPSQIRAVNVTLAARSEYPLMAGSSAAQYAHNNLSTQVSVRSLSFLNQFNTSTTAP